VRERERECKLEFQLEIGAAFSRLELGANFKGALNKCIKFLRLLLPSSLFEEKKKMANVSGEKVRASQFFWKRNSQYLLLKKKNNNLFFVLFEKERERKEEDKEDERKNLKFKKNPESHTFPS